MPGPGESLLIVLTAAGLYGLGGAFLRSAFGEVGLLAASWLLLLGPCVAWIHLTGRDVKASLALRRASWRQIAAGAGLVLGALPLVWLVGWLQSFVLPVPPELADGLRAQVTAESPGRLLWLLFLVAVTPSVCEECLFRGVFLTGTMAVAARWSVVLNGLVFGAFHLSGGGLARFLPTATLGIVIAWAVWRTGALVVGIVMHALNNAVIVVTASLGAGEAIQGAVAGPPPLWLLPVGLAACAIGVIVLLERPSAGQTPFFEDP